ncbi:DMT family transporter [Alicyclobacillus mengziensis]|uniref:DMT family transporter n=1 Tax=Alicyclobacillus mengziensis TaxID=2931921 RepID=A0A9X7VVW3_9BACL|nr:DMT family transporter [Alicyclobacillus mengziensis]QSO45820.1 DMT family transporter [Alicyclobacillus mengziensis]
MIRGFLLLMLATLLWSGNYIAGRLLAPAMPALVLNGVRWTLSALELYIILMFTGKRLPLREKWREFLLLGFVGMFIFSALTYLGLHSTPAAQAGMISGLIPVAILFFGVFILKDKGSRMAWFGSLVSVIGVLVLLGGHAGSGFTVSLGDVEILAAAGSWGLYTVLGKRFGRDMDPLTLTAGAAVFGAIPSDIAGLFSFSPHAFHMTSTAWMALVYVSTAASVIAYFAWTVGVERVGASRAAAWMNLLPVWTAVSGIVMLGERMTTVQMIGGALVLLGAVFAGRR